MILSSESSPCFLVSLQWRGTANADRRPRGVNNTPFHPHQEETTFYQYLNTITRLLGMFWQMKDHPSYYLPLPDTVTKALTRYFTVLETDESDHDPLHDVFMSIWRYHWPITPNNTIPDPTHRLLVLMSLQPDGGHKDPSKMTQPIAHLKYALRLAFALEISQNATHVYDGQPFLAYQQLKEWLHEKLPCTFNTLCTLQHLATSITMSTLGLPQIFWTDRLHHRSLLYLGSDVHFSDFKAMFQEMEDDLIDLFENQVLLGLKDIVLVPLPTRIHEDLTKTSEGYSFVNDPRNPSFIAARSSLFDAIRDDPVLKEHFVRVENGDLVWNKYALRQWLMDYGRFSCHLMARCEMLSGGPGRGTELTAMSFRSTKTYRQRNLSILDRHVAMIRTYTKISALIGQDQLIPHSLDGLTSALVIQNLVVCRPFAELAASICFPDNDEVLQLYQYKLFVNINRPFKSDDLTQIMSKYTLKHLGFKCGIRPWRHIAIAFRRHLCPLAHAFFEDIASANDRDTAAILQLGHSRQTEDRRYAITADTMHGLSEEIIPLYLDASVDWQIVCEVVPGMCCR